MNPDGLNKYLEIDRSEFGKDPFGYSASSYQIWGLIQTAAGFDVDISIPATTEDLKNPILWMAQAHALAQAATTVLIAEHKFETMPFGVRNICDRQYCSVGLMLVGYSLEISLKAMMILKHGITGYMEIERSIQHHRLEELASFVPGLSDKDKAILRGLTNFVYWAGRYPDPGVKRISEAEEIFQLSEAHKITAGDVFYLSKQLMSHIQSVIDSRNQKKQSA